MGIVHLISEGVYTTSSWASLSRTIPLYFPASDHFQYFHVRDSMCPFHFSRFPLIFHRREEEGKYGFGWCASTMKTAFESKGNTQHQMYLQGNSCDTMYTNERINSYSCFLKRSIENIISLSGRKGTFCHITPYPTVMKKLANVKNYRRLLMMT